MGREKAFEFYLQILLLFSFKPIGVQFSTPCIDTKTEHDGTAISTLVLNILEIKRELLIYFINSKLLRVVVIALAHAKPWGV